jgi:hypothetical protein
VADGRAGIRARAGELTLEELEGQRTELVESRNMMHVIGRRYKKKKYPIPTLAEREGINCAAAIGVAPPGSPCFDGHYHVRR